MGRMSNKMVPILGKAKEMALGFSCAKEYGKKKISKK